VSCVQWLFCIDPSSPISKEETPEESMHCECLQDINIVPYSTGRFGGIEPRQRPAPFCPYDTLSYNERAVSAPRVQKGTEFCN
jgi:hypothetical protein